MGSDTAARLRWATVDDEDAGRLPGTVTPERVTHPEFQGMEFLHVRAKSLLNHVPAAAGLPFQWTINVYRGCSHACSYCLVGDTPILMADGTTRPLGHLQPDDKIVGTRFVDGRREPTTTVVRDHWQTTRRAHRLTLADGTRLIASADHRFLSASGWKHVARGDGRDGARPTLTREDAIVGLPPAGGATGVVTGPGRQVVEIEDLGVDVPMFDITTGTGDFIANGVVSHNCFARPTHEYLELGAGRDFERVVVVKVNAVERLRAELHRPSWKGETVALGTNTDPYQRAEGRYRLTRGVLETLTEAGNPFSLLTKGTLVTRDLDILTEAAHRGVCTGVSMSIPTLDEQVWRESEPGTPHPKARVETIARLSEAGVPTGVMVAPILPGLSDGAEQLDEVVAAAYAAGAGSVTPIVLHLRPGVREVFWPWLTATHPELEDAYQRWYRSTEAAEAVKRRIHARFDRATRRHRPAMPAPRARRVRAADAPADRRQPDSEQLRLV